ncbi:hypothetical protein ASG84_23515 [Rhodococcus sp. Leaf278]|uniref:PPE domain-containing protein n=1 Tax=Rhodococcus sp. Leaf278 TaxID=1736319 RepID=UPI00070E762C|nr:PPE domain-containing protein [Rhodococcus sp. Leaf278]KQU54007.1 hypothetical protein ASG84_23515 [Rhodococcus sp. Leaf278]
MTLGVTGVVWLPRTATGNSTRLLGPGPVPLHVAGGAWGSVAAAFTEASASIAAVTAALTAGWEGESALLAQAALARFATWTGTTALKAAALSVEAPAAGTTYGVALATMPSLVEIGVVQAAKVTAASTGGALNGSYEAAEVADRLLDIRAALVMEGFELVNSHRIVKTTFDHPPAIVSDSGSGLGKFANAVMTSPVQAAIGGLMAATQNPGVAAAAGQIGSAATSIASTGASTVATAASNIGSTVLSGGSGMGGGHGFAPGGSASLAVDPASTRPVSLGAGGAGLTGFGGAGMPGSSLGPAGGSSAGSGASLSGAGQGGAFGASTGSDGGLAQRGTGGAGAPASGTRGQVEDDEHETPDYLKQFEHFADGRTVAPSVIGADPAISAPDTSGNGR